MSAPENYSVATLAGLTAHDFGESEPVLIDQDRINAFADCTGDHQWIHTDPERAASHSPFGGTIAHGMLVLSLLAGKHLELGIYPPDARQIINYGMNKVRFLAPVPVGAVVRVAVSITGVEVKRPGQIAVTTTNEVRIDGADKPAIIAEQIAFVMG
ncbi:MaoC family dehydratase [Pukyongiella litopenaei]|uniref:MaoC family dehydratase n=1 Tax=Pukyongiella litopenaei TaxID=2605946 RepID=A0A2S0MPI5_9RHOB|nr:MaoC family dehydratase [Pukyongiella litopenaei]AVO37812.1 MaoC family dehydratase [Pukyongiella litopenaei]